MSSFNKVLSYLKTKNSKINIYYKDKSNLMKLLSYVLFFNKNFNDYTTTIGNNVYFPSEKYIQQNDVIAAITLIHEYVHIDDRKNYGLWFSFSYLLPQIFALLFIALLPIKFLISALGLILFLLPLPAYFRKVWEVRGYTANLIAYYVLYPDKVDRFDMLIDVYNDNFIYSQYYYMWVFGVKQELNKNLEDIISGDIFNKYDVYVTCREAASLIDKGEHE